MLGMFKRFIRLAAIGSPASVPPPVTNNVTLRDSTQVTLRDGTTNVILSR